MNGRRGWVEKNGYYERDYFMKKPKTSGTYREQTRAEHAAIRKLVKDLCANHDHEYGCLLLDGNCYMFYGVAYTNTGLCKYFRDSILPTDPILEATLTGGVTVETRPCGICGRAFPVNGKKAYCSDACAGKAKNRKQRGYMRERRGGS